MKLTVRDYGPGIPEAELARVFEPFYRIGSELTRRHEGVGLGLSLVQRLVADMHGELRCRNAEPGLELELLLRK